MAAAIFEATSPSDFGAFGALVPEYVDWCRQRYEVHAWAVDLAFSYQALDRELESLACAYGSPNGRTLLAEGEGQIQGCVAYRRLSDGVCEMKRLFVRGQFHGEGLGRRLCAAIIEKARSDGFSIMRLDTGHLFHEAKALYRTSGFVECEPYHDYPTELLPFILCMERSLAAA